MTYRDTAYLKINFMPDYDAYYEDYVREDREDGVYLTPEINKNILAKDGSIRYA